MFAQADVIIASCLHILHWVVINKTFGTIACSISIHGHVLASNFIFSGLDSAHPYPSRSFHCGTRARTTADRRKRILSQHRTASWTFRVAIFRRHSQRLEKSFGKSTRRFDRRKSVTCRQTIDGDFD